MPVVLRKMEGAATMLWKREGVAAIEPVEPIGSSRAELVATPGDRIYQAQSFKQPPC
jgi:hypothetical protein